MYDDPPFRTQVKLVGRREGEKAKVKRETAAGNLYRLSGGALWRHSSLTCKDRLQDLAVKKAMIQQAYNFCCQQIHRFNLLGKSIGSKLIIDRILGSEFWSFFPHPPLPIILVLLVYASLEGFQFSEAVLKMVCR